MRKCNDKTSANIIGIQSLNDFWISGLRIDWKRSHCKQVAREFSFETSKAFNLSVKFGMNLFIDSQIPNPLSKMKKTRDTFLK